MNAINLNIEEKIDKNYELNVLGFKFKNQAVNLCLPTEYFYLLMIKKGEGKYFCDFKEHPFTNDSIIAISKGETAFINFAGIGSIDFDIVVFSEHILVCPEAHIRMKDLPVLQRNKEKSIFQSDSKDFTEIKNCVEKLKNETGTNIRWQWNMVRIYLAEILISLSRILTGSADRQDENCDDLIYKFYDLIEVHYTDHQSVDFYAVKLGISPAVLSKKIKSVTGKTFQVIINDRVITEAMRKLFTTGRSIKEIAYELGYEDTAYFYRKFKKISGYTPQEFRAYALKKYT